MKKEVIGAVLKALYVYEIENDKNFDAYLVDVINYLSGLSSYDVNEQTINRSVINIRGLKNNKEDRTHSVVRKIVLDTCNLIDRNFKEE